MSQNSSRYLKNLYTTWAREVVTDWVNLVILVDRHLFDPSRSRYVQVGQIMELNSGVAYALGNLRAQSDSLAGAKDVSEVKKLLREVWPAKLDRPDATDVLATFNAVRWEERSFELLTFLRSRQQHLGRRIVVVGALPRGGSTAASEHWAKSVAGRILTEEGQTEVYSAVAGDDGSLVLSLARDPSAQGRITPYQGEEQAGKFINAVERAIIDKGRYDCFITCSIEIAGVFVGAATAFFARDSDGVGDRTSEPFRRFLRTVRSRVPVAIYGAWRDLIDDVLPAPERGLWDRLPAFPGPIEDMVSRLATHARHLRAGSIAIFIGGPSGAGKTHLVKALCKRLRIAEYKPFDLSKGEEAVDELVKALEAFASNKTESAVAAPHGVAQDTLFFVDEVLDVKEKGQDRLLNTIVNAQKAAGAQRRLYLVSASFKNMRRLINREQFRRDLSYRLMDQTLTMPALSERKEEIPLMAYALLGELDGNFVLDVDGLEALQAVELPGNVRDLIAILHSAVALASARYPSGDSGPIVIRGDDVMLAYRGRPRPLSGR